MAAQLSPDGAEFCRKRSLILSLLLTCPLGIQLDSIWHHLVCVSVHYFLLAVLPSDMWVCNRWKHQSGHPEGKHKETNF